MTGNLRWRLGWVAVLIGFFAFLTVANFIPKEERVESGLWPDEGLRLGLDLQGGIHWVVGVDLSEAVKRELEFARSLLLEDVKDSGVSDEDVRVRDNRIVVQLSSPDGREAVEKAAEQVRMLREVSSSDSLAYELTSVRTQEIHELDHAAGS